MDIEIIGNILSLHRGYDLTAKEMNGGNVPVAGSNGIIGYHDKALTDAPAITVGRSGSVGKVHFYEEPIWPHNTSLFVDDFKGNSPSYIYYLLSLLDLGGLCDNSVIPSLNRNFVYPLKVPFIKGKDKQEKCTSVLRKIDKLISIKREENAQLEALAKRIYDYWFVQFDFPNEEGKPYKSSGGKMVWNETLKREIPEGWETKSLNDLSSSTRGVTYSPSDLVDKTSGILVLRGNNIDNNHIVYDSNVAYIPGKLVSPEQSIRKYDIIMTMSSGSKEHLGKSAMFYNDSLHTYGAFLNKFTPKEECAYYFFECATSTYFKKKVKAICNGTGINNLSNSILDSIVFPYPDDNMFVMTEFNKRVKYIFDMIGNNVAQIDDLLSLRSYLLPLLMNGQITIKD